MLIIKPTGILIGGTGDRDDGIIWFEAFKTVVIFPNLNRKKLQNQRKTERLHFGTARTRQRNHAIGQQYTRWNEAGTQL
jgi:hypothetical protein